MKPFSIRAVLTGTLTWALVACMQTPSLAHMAWLATDADGQAIFWFGESPDDRTYHLPERVATIKLYDTTPKQPLNLQSVDSEAFIGLRGQDSSVNAKELYGSVTYGLYHGMKLTYHVEHLPQTDPQKWPQKPRPESVLQTVIRPHPSGGISVTVLRNGEPVEGADVKLYCSEGHVEGEAKSDSKGNVAFTGDEVEPGLNAVLVGLRNEKDPGKLDGEDYQSSADYLTSSFFIPGASRQTKAASDVSSPDGPVVDRHSTVTVVPSGLPDLPEELTSFGAAIAGDQLFVYGGHTGDAHSYSTDEQSNRLWKLDLRNPSEGWKQLGTDKRLQGLALVPWNESVVRIGGFSAMNASGEEHDLRSQTAVSLYDAKQQSWQKLPSLPEPRSSLDAAIIGGRVFVFGGWQLSGESEESSWHDTAWSLDLANLDAGWEVLPAPPFKRRAISVAAHKGKLYVVGGMQEQGGPTTRVDIYDPKKQTWTVGPSLPGKGMSGFGSSAFAVEGKLYVSTMDGFVHQLDDTQGDWKTVATIKPARFFHRMLPYQGNLLLVGGGNMQIGKFTQIDRIELQSSGNQDQRPEQE